MVKHFIVNRQCINNLRTQFSTLVIPIYTDGWALETIQKHRNQTNHAVDTDTKHDNRGEEWSQYIPPVKTGHPTVGAYRRSWDPSMLSAFHGVCIIDQSKG
jgi:hypothetical protein